MDDVINSYYLFINMDNNFFYPPLLRIGFVEECSLDEGGGGLERRTFLLINGQPGYEFVEHVEYLGFVFRVFFFRTVNMLFSAYPILLTRR